LVLVFLRSVLIFTVRLLGIIRLTFYDL
jgi:hypothetical protein